MSKLSEDILANIDIVDVVWRYVQLKRVGRNFVGLSPFRNEKTPSFTVSPEKQIFKCFSTGIGGNVIKFIMEMEKIEYRDAAQILAKDAGIDLKQYQTKSPEKWEKDGNEKEKYKLMMRIAQQYFVEELHKNAAALQYLHEQRRLWDDIIKTRWIGYAPEWSFGLPKLLMSKGFTPEDCTNLGLAKKWQTWEMYGFYRNRITFPIYDHMWNLVGFGARAINPEDQPKYLNSSDSPIYDKSKILYGLDQAKSHLREYEKLVVVEWYMDVVGASRLWLPIAVGTCGTSLTPQHMKLLKRYTSNIFFLFDNDPAGIQASQRALKIAYQNDVYPKMLKLPAWFKDIDERANVKPSEAEITACFDQAEDGFLATVKMQISANDMQNPVERKRFLQAVFEVLLYVQDFSILSWYLETISKQIGMSYDVLFSQFKNFTKTQSTTLAYIRKEQEQQTGVIKEWQPDTNNKFQAFFLGSFLQDNDIHDEPLDALMMLVVEIAEVIWDDTLMRVVSGDAWEMQHILLQAQLWREKHRWTVTPDKKIVDIKRECQKYLHNAQKIIIKMQSLNPQEKQDLMKRMQGVV
jgi:DNA primase